MLACLTLCMLGIFSMLFCLMVFFQKSSSFRNTTSVSNSLDPDQVLHFAGPDLGPNCLHMLSEDDTTEDRL